MVERDKRRVCVRRRCVEKFHCCRRGDTDVQTLVRGLLRHDDRFPGACAGGKSRQRPLCRVARKSDGARCRSSLRQDGRLPVPGLCRRLEGPREPDQGRIAARRRLRQRVAQNQRRPCRRRERQLGELVGEFRAIAAGDRLQPRQPLRRRAEIQAVVCRAPGAGHKDRPDRSQARPQGRADSEAARPGRAGL